MAPTLQEMGAEDSDSSEVMSKTVSPFGIDRSRLKTGDSFDLTLKLKAVGNTSCASSDSFAISETNDNCESWPALKKFRATCPTQKVFQIDTNQCLFSECSSDAEPTSVAD